MLLVGLEIGFGDFETFIIIIFKIFNLKMIPDSFLSRKTEAVPILAHLDVVQVLDIIYYVIII